MHRWMCLLLTPTLVAAAPSTREMSLKTSDGFTLKGTLALPEGKGRKPVVILAHEFRSDRGGWAPLVEELHARGIGTLALDLRGHGASTDKGGAEVKVTDDFAASAKAVGFDRIPEDLELAVKWLRTQPGVHAKRLGLAGSSVGGFSVLLAAPKVRPYVVVALSPAGSVAFGERAKERLSQATQKSGVAVFVLGAEEDGDAAACLGAVKALPGVHAQLLGGKVHGFGLLPERKDTLAVFFGEYLNHPHMAQAAPAPKAPEEGK